MSESIGRDRRAPSVLVNFLLGLALVLFVPVFAFIGSSAWYLAQQGETLKNQIARSDDQNKATNSRMDEQLRLANAHAEELTRNLASSTTESLRNVSNRFEEFRRETQDKAASDAGDKKEFTAALNDIKERLSNVQAKLNFMTSTKTAEATTK